MDQFLRHVALALLWLMLGSGCQRVWVEDPGNLLGLAGPVEPIPAEIETASLFPLEKARGRFRIVEGEQDGLDFEWNLKPAPHGWIYSYEGLQRVWLVKDAQDALRITREDDLDEEVQVTYEPGLLMLPRLIRSEVEETETATMVVRSLDGRELRSTGICSNTITVVGRQKVNTPAGDFMAILVRSHRRIQLPIASVEVEILSAYVPGKGQVAERVTQKIRALRFFDMEEGREVRLAK